MNEENQEENRVKYEEIVIKWSSNEPLNEIEDLIKILNKEKGDSNRLLYQIYGDHHIYGRDVLLYIGISTKIKQRFKTHLKGVFNYVNNKSISVGHLENYTGILQIPESILIANHKPAFNKEFIHSLAKKKEIDDAVEEENESVIDHKILIINNGNNGMLKTCCTNYWWVVNK
ncbi:MAG: hypothetical protein WDZ35_09575 [Crocinitomicaceae bacterium]